MLALTTLALLASCSKDKTDDTAQTAAEWRPDVVACPGAPGCESNEGELLAGAALEPITPTCYETWEDLDGNGDYDRYTEAFYDCGCDHLCEGDEGYPGPDEGEGDGEFQAVWIAGFGNSRPAQGVHDDLWARAVVVQTGDTSVAIVALDLVGWFYNNTVAIREAVADLGVDVDHVIVHATHVHEGPDTMGQWGARVGESGINPDYQAYVISQAALAVQEASAALQPATLSLSSIDTAAPFGDKGTHNTVRDSRDPVIIDELLSTAQLTDAQGGTIATLVNWGNHPEALDSDNDLLTSDFVHYVRESVEDGVHYDSYDVDGLGGVCIYLNAAVGGLMTPLHITVTDGEGVDHSEANWDKAEALGKVLGELALQSVAEGTPADAPQLAVWGQSLYLPIDNFLFQAAFLIGIFDRPAYNYDPDQNLGEDNTPELLTEVDMLTLGPLHVLTIPGEMAPELGIGGYDGSHVNSAEVDFIDPDSPNPPDVSLAPAPPYFKDRLGGDYSWIIGLGNDEVGYLIPSYDYKLDEQSPYVVEAEGDHYEETNSLGPRTVPLLSEVVEQVTEWSP